MFLLVREKAVASVIYPVPFFFLHVVEPHKSTGNQAPFL